MVHKLGVAATYVLWAATLASDHHVITLAWVGIGCLLGVWSAPSLKSNPPKRSMADMFADFHTDLSRMDDHTGILFEQWRDGGRQVLPAAYLAEVTSFFETARKLHLPVPTLDSSKPEKTAQIVYAYTKQLLPLSRDGHFQRAKDIAQSIADSSKEYLA